MKARPKGALSAIARMALKLSLEYIFVAVGRCRNIRLLTIPFIAPLVHLMRQRDEIYETRPVIITKLQYLLIVVSGRDGRHMLFSIMLPTFIISKA